MNVRDAPSRDDKLDKTIDDLFGTVESPNDGNVFAQLSGNDVEGQQQEGEVTRQPEQDGDTLTDDVSLIPAELAGKKDYSDLLAEFEGELEALQANQGQSEDVPSSAGVTNRRSSSPQTTSLPHGDARRSSPFADLLAESDPGPAESSVDSTLAESPIPDLSIEDAQHDAHLLGLTDDSGGDTSVRSLFSNASDCLADTTMDNSFQVDDGEEEEARNSATPAHPKIGERKESVPFAVPQGWYDEVGQWQWYTQEEKEQVRLTLLGDQAWGIEGKERVEQDQSGQDQPVAVSFSPSIYSGISENAARRSPQPEQTASRFEPNPFDPNSPHSLQSPVTASTASFRSSSGSSSAYTERSFPHLATAPSQPSRYAATSPNDPYAPITHPYPSQYAPQRSPSNLAPPRAGPSNPPASAPKPAAPQRMASNAYDPPFLRPQKSFVRSASTVAVVSPAFAAHPPFVLPAQPKLPAAPPSGPARRTWTGDRPPSRGPSTAAPLFVATGRQQSFVSIAGSSTATGYGKPISSPPNELQTSADPSPYGSMAQAHQPQSTYTDQALQSRPSPRTASFASFDSSLRPASTSARSSFVTPATRNLTFPTASSPEPVDSGYIDPGIARRAHSRKASPISEARPPSRTSARGVGDLMPSSVDHGSCGELPRDLRTPSEEISDARGQERSSPHHSATAAKESDFGKDGPRRHEYGPQRERHELSQSPANDALQRPMYQAPSYDPSAEERVFDGSMAFSELGLHQVGSPPQPVPAQPSSDPYALMTDGDGIADDHISHTPPQPGEYVQYARKYASSYEPATYAPSAQTAGVSRDAYDRGESPTYGNDYGPSQPETYYFQAASMREDSYIPQQVLEQRPVSEDSLGRCTTEARNIPLAVFGFGGVLITAFPAMADDGNAPGHARSPSYGYASGRGQLWIRRMSELAADSALKSNDSSFPGPLVLDPASPKGAATDKKKREAVMAYLEARAAEINKGLPYLKSSASRARREEEGKLVLVRLLTAMIVGDGKLSGTARVEDAIRAALANPSSESNPSSHPSMAPISPGNTYGSVYPLPVSRIAAPAIASPAQLAQLSAMLLSGDKPEAAQYAASAGLWSHALIISSYVDQELWKDVVSRFAASELSGNIPGTAAMKASYALFSGSVATSVNDLISAANVSDDPSSDQWREVLSAVVFNGKPGELACLDELGNRLMTAGLVSAAHACSLLSPSSPFADATPAAFDRTIILTQNPRDEDAAIFAEIAEYARSLVPPAKGQEASFPGLPQLLPYKLYRAWRAAELGDIDQARRYCAAVESASKPVKNGTPLMPHTLLASLGDLLERLNGTPSPNPVNVTGGRKAAKPGFDTLGSWIEGRLTKFIAGEEDGKPAPTKSTAAPLAKGNSQAQVGPFSHFSTISPGAPGQISRTTSTADFAVANGHLEIPPDSRRTSPNIPSQERIGNDHHARESSSPSSSFGDHFAPHAVLASAFTPSVVDEGAPPAHEDARADDTAHPQTDLYGDDQGLLNPMQNLAIDRRRSGPSTSSYWPDSQQAGDDDEDYGFGNISLSRGRTPKPSEESQGSGGPGVKPAEVKHAKADTASIDPLSKTEQKGSWLGRWWGKKEDESSGPIKAKLGEESSMVYDRDLKRWVMKGAKGDAAIPAAPPAPPRSGTASPSRTLRLEASSDRTVSATPPLSQLSRNSMPPSASSGAPSPLSSSATAGFTENGGLKRMKSSLAESVIPADASGSDVPPGPPRPPPLGNRPPTAASLDDLLSRPPSRRPASAAAKKGARNRYVDVFQPGAEGSS